MVSSSNIDEHMQSVYEEMAAEIQALAASVDHQVLIGIAGAPGAGKSTTSRALVSLIPNSILLPMDGYHYTRAYLQAMDDPVEAVKRRGSHWTFNGPQFVSDLRNLRTNQHGMFPSFDHGKGDPVENDIHITEEHKIVIVEGNYLLLDIAPWDEVKSILDFSYFINCDIEVSNHRVYSRHLTVGRTEAQAKDRVLTNDGLNAEQILACKNRADKIVESK